MRYTTIKPNKRRCRVDPDLLTQFLIDITRGRLRDAFEENAAGVIAAAPLDDLTATAVREENIGALWCAGAHPMALLLFSRLCRWAGDRYYSTVADAETKCNRAAIV
jgi:hypothetical protein